MGFVKKENATLFLVINAVLWGSSYVWNKMLLSYLPRFSILFLCSLGGLVATIIIFSGRLRGIDKSVILPAAAVSLLSIASNTFFMLALQHTTSSNTAFIVQTSVILTPIMMCVIERRRPEGRTIGGGVVALLGMFFITCNFGTFAFNIGDLLALCNAVFFTCFLVGLKTVCGKTDPVHFSLIHQAVNSAGFFILSALFEAGAVDYGGFRKPAFILLLAVSVAVTAATILLQSAAIKHERPERATLIYTLEPVAALVLAFLFVNERPEGLGPVLGSALILVSILWAGRRGQKRKERVNEVAPRSKAIQEL